MDDLRDGQSNFWFSEMARIPYQVTIYEEEIDMVKFPLSGIVFPFAGERILRISMLVVNADDVSKIYLSKDNIAKSKIILYDFVEFYHKFDGYGFLETLELYKDSLKEVVKLLYLIAEADGQVQQSELDGIYAFLNKRVSLIEDNQKRDNLSIELKHEVDKYLNMDDVIVLDLLEQASSYLKKNTDATYCLEVYEICLQVAVADGVYSTEEKDLMEEIAFALDISKDKQKEMYDRHLRLKMAGQFSDEEFLGILPSMSLAEKKSHLTKEYNKWRGRISNESKDIAVEANMRIEKITKLRDTLNKTG
jgi:tellurite resistance protein